LDFYRVGLLKQQSADRHATPLGHIILISIQRSCHEWYSWKIAELALSNNHSHYISSDSTVQSGSKCDKSLW
jgi:hypothetical protein